MSSVQRRIFLAAAVILTAAVRKFQVAAYGRRLRGSTTIKTVKATLATAGLGVIGFWVVQWIRAARELLAANPQGEFR